MADTSLSDVDEAEQQQSSCSPGGACYRYVALFFMCVVGFGSCFCFDNPGALQDIITQRLALSTTEFSYLYSVYSWPNVILCFVGGFLIDRVFGIKAGAILYAIIVVIGQLVFALGGLVESFWIMILGRIIFGVGGESLQVAQNYYAVLWFKGKELNMVFGLQLSIARVGSAVNFIIMGHLYDFVQKYFQTKDSLGVVLFLASITCIASFLCAVALAFMNQKKPIEPAAVRQEEKVVRLKDVMDFIAPFWLTCVICVAYYVAIFPFIALGKVFFIRKFDFTPDKANLINSLVYMVSGVASPLLGLLIDKSGRNLLWMTLAICFTIVAHTLLAFTFFYPSVSVIMLGFSYSLLASALWPIIALIIPDYQLGTAYGVAQAVQNGGLAIATLLAGMVVDSGGYLMLGVFFLGSLCVALIAVLLMWIYDIKHTGILNMTKSQRSIYERNQLTSDIIQRQGLLRSASVSDISPYAVTEPQSNFNIRNRYLSRIGATSVPFHITPPSGYMYRNLR